MRLAFDGAASATGKARSRKGATLKRTTTRHARQRQRPHSAYEVPSGMTTSSANRQTDPEVGWLARAVSAGTWASALSVVMLAIRGRHEAGTAAAPLNAPSHWLFGREALRSNRPSWRHTLSGLLIHHGSSLFWGLLYSRLLQQGQHCREPASTVLAAVGVTALAAWVDFRLVPKRLTPGFEHRLSKSSLMWVYGAFAAGLALGGLRSSKRKER